MNVSVRHVGNEEEEQVVLNCVRMTKEFEEIKEFILMYGSVLTGYLRGAAFQIFLKDILYFEAVGAKVFAYTEKEVYLIKRRLYELEELYERQNFVRCSKSVLVNILKIESFRPAMNSRCLIRMKNGEDIIVSRMYAKQVKNKVMKSM